MLAYNSVKNIKHAIKYRIVTEENRSVLTKVSIEVKDSPAVSVKRIIQTMKKMIHRENIFKTNNEVSADDWNLGKMVDAVAELRRMAEDPLFSKIFVFQGGLRLVMEILGGTSVVDYLKLMQIGETMLHNLAPSKTKREEVEIEKVYQEAVNSLPTLIKHMTSRSDLLQLASIRLINTLLDKATRKAKYDMIDLLLKESYDKTYDLIQKVNSPNNEIDENINKELLILRKTLITGLDDEVKKGLLMKEINLVGKKRQNTFANLLKEIDEKLKIPQLISSDVLDVCFFIRKSFVEGHTVESTLAHLTGIQQEVCLMVLNLLFPEMKETIESIANLPLDKFTTAYDVMSFIDALINSGVAAEVERGVMFVMGNTGVGKTSFVNTLKHFIENPTEIPQSLLAENYRELLETQVLELYEDVSLENIQHFAVNLKDIYSNPILVNLYKESEPVIETAKKKSLKIIDLGGHQEYFCCSTLFIASSGLFLVCTDSSDLAEDSLQSEYYSRVGTYVDQICQATLDTKVKPKICLVATKVDPPGRNQENCFNTLLSLAKSHLSSIEKDTFLVDKVLKTSAKNVTKENLETIHGKLSCLCTNASLKNEVFCSRPFSWFRLLDKMRDSSSANLEEVIKMYQDIKVETKGATNISKEEIEDLEKFKQALKLFRQQPKKKCMVSQQESFEYDNESDESKGFLNKFINTQIDKTVEENNYKEVDESEVNGQHLRQSFSSDLCKEDEVMEEISVILDFFVGLGDILWYKENQKLSNLVITRPMDLVKTLRTVICHKVSDSFKGVRFRTTKQNLLIKGLLSKADFKVLYNSKHNQAFTLEHTWDFLIHLGLACALEDDLILIPSLISNHMEAKIEKREKEMTEDERSVCVQYSFDRNMSSQAIYHKLLQVFTKNFLWGEKGGDIELAFSQKVEQRRLGRVSGIQGVLKWHTQDIQKPQEFGFLILEYETTVASADLEYDPENNFYAIQRDIRIHLQPEEDRLMKDMLKILSELNIIFASIIGDSEDVQRSWLCKKCWNKPGLYELNENMRLRTTSSLCSLAEHKLSKSTTKLLSDSSDKNIFRLKSLMESDKSTLGLQPFKTSQIRTKILQNKLERGEQIWIYHDGETDPSNPVARVNPYAHCVVYVGQRMIEDKATHEVVHVAKDFSGLMNASIRQEDVLKVIEPHNMVFLGHRIATCQFSGNVRQMISERALACAETPHIIFNYNPR